MIRSKERWLRYHTKMTNLQEGDQVYCAAIPLQPLRREDPIECVASGHGKFIRYVDDEVALITKDGVQLEVFISELS